MRGHRPEDTRVAESLEEDRARVSNGSIGLSVRLPKLSAEAWACSLRGRTVKRSSVHPREDIMGFKMNECESNPQPFSASNALFCLCDTKYGFCRVLT